MGVGDTVVAMPLFPTVACILALGAMPTALPAEPPAATGGIASHAASWRRVAGGDWAFVAWYGFEMTND